MFERYCFLLHSSRGCSEAWALATLELGSPALFQRLKGEIILRGEALKCGVAQHIDYASALLEVSGSQLSSVVSTITGFEIKKITRSTSRFVHYLCASSILWSFSGCGAALLRVSAAIPKHLIDCSPRWLGA